MSNYQNGKIYKIIDHTNNNVYIGSTCKTLKERLSRHEYNYKAYLNEKDDYRSSFSILKNNNYKILLIEAFPCNSKKELTQREGYYIKSVECVNNHVPGRTKKESDKQYYETNKQMILDRCKQKCKQKITCICGSIVAKHAKARHEKTKKHISFLKTQQVVIN